MICERPFDHRDVEKNSRYKYKVEHRDKLKSMFAPPGLVVSPATVHATPSSSGRSGRVAKSTTTKRGALKLLNDDGSITVAATNKIKDRLTDRKHLETHEIDMLHALLQTYLSSSIERKHKLTSDQIRLLVN